MISDGRPATLGDALAGIVMIGAIVYGGYWLITRGDANKRPLYQVRTETQAEMAQRCGAFVRALGWVALLNAAWSAGEAVGYLFGPDPRPRIF